jgi:hypothetical protein
MFANPTAKWALVVEQLVTTPLVTSFFTTWRAAVSDKISGTAYARASALIGVSAGGGMLGGTFLATAVMNRADVKYCFLLSSLISLVSLGYVKFVPSLTANSGVV